MSKINILDSSIFNRIAAGEVVENPRSIVKELVENSIDAGADSITVEINGGGIASICVADNGKGIDREDIPKAFMPHATSKIGSIKDLENISTLGFRGEALPSIASVAEVEMVSRTEENDLGYKIVLNGGKITDEGECGCPFGTRVTVKNLFANIPARAKFLRKPQSEEGSVTEFIIKIILANPYIKIKYVADGETVYRSDGNGVDSAIYTVYGDEFLANLSSISYTMPDISLSGYVCKPDFTKHNRNYQTMIVNGRYIINADISYCIQQCYQNYLMKRQFPAYVLYLNIPSDMVDVNVHPNKLDVRFANEKRLKGIIYNTIKAKVDELAVEPVTFSPIVPEHAEPAANTQPAAHETFFGIAEMPRSAFRSENPKIAEESIIRTKLNNFVKSIEYNGVPASNEENIAAKGGALRQQSDYAATNEENNEPLFGNIDALRFAGKLFNTYLFVESGNDFFVVDQHAAHEKLLYDKLVEQADSGITAVQDLLVPYIFEVSPSEKAVLIDNLEQINECGFKIDHLNGCKFSLYALPVCCSDINMQQFVSLLLSDADIPKRNSGFIKEKLMQAACKSAVKGDMDLTESEIDSLINQMRQSGSARFCPHGRPTVIKFSKSDLEKFFKRI